MESLTYDLDEILIGAIMSNTPAIIVEGRDDVKFYETISADCKKDVEVYAVENIEDYAGGCNSVIKCLEKMQSKIDEREENANYILGIIDKDSRYYKKNIPSHLQGLFILKYYSYETHFITKNNLKRLIADLTSVSTMFIDDRTLNFVQTDLIQDYENLFMISLEALKKECFPDYKAIISYGENINLKILHTIGEKIRSEKKFELQKFAKELNIVIDDIKKISKGKWLLYVFCNSVFKRIKQLQQACKEESVPQCQFCKCHRNDQCLWKLRIKKYQCGHIVDMLQNYYDEDELKYIKDRIKLLGCHENQSIGNTLSQVS